MTASEALEWCRKHCATVEFQQGYIVQSATGQEERLPSGWIKVSVEMSHGSLDLAGKSFEETVSAVADAHKLWKEREAR